MNHSVRVDLNHFIKHLLQALKPVAKAEDIDLSFSPSDKPVMGIFQAALLVGDITHIICKLVEFTPEQEKITVSIETSNPLKCRIIIRNTGINLARNSEIIHPCKLTVTVHSPAHQATQYEIEVDLHQEETITDPIPPERINGHNYIDYYAEIRKRLRSHFTKSDNLVEVLSRHNPREAAFLKKVNDVIISNIENRQFDANHLSEIMNMSRT